MAITENTYMGDGSTVLFPFTFEYIAESDIKITLDGTPTTAYTLANATTIQFNTAPANGVGIRIYRDTNIDTLSAEFFPGSAIRAEDLNNNFTQNLYVTQEVSNNAVQSDDSTPFVNDISMGGYKITNLADPVAGDDAATRSFVEQSMSSDFPIFYRRWSKTAAGGETSLSGTDDNGISLSYVAGSEKVFINGALQVRGVDYTGTTGTTLTGIPALTAGDIVEVHSSSNYTVATLPEGSITNANVDGGAAIQYSKLNLSNSIVNADVNSSAGIVASKLNFTQSGTGATTRTVESKLRDVVSVRDFGAVGDGVADDTAAIQAAINAASGGNSTVYMPDGVYRITSGLTIPDDGITIEGHGFGRSLSVSENTGTRILADFASGWVITCLQACFTLRDVEIYGSDSVRWASAGSVDGTKGAIYIRNGVQSLLERVLIYQEPGIGIYMSHECPSSKLTQVTVEYCKGHAYYVDDGALDSSSGYVACGIITFDSCRAARVDCCALVAGDATDESGTGLSAYRLKLINCEFFFCGGNTALSALADYVIRFNSDNCSWEGSAVSSPNGQAGGNSTTTGTLASGGSAALVSGIYVNGRNNHLLNNRYIRTYIPAVKVTATASNTVIDGVEARHTAGTDYDTAISFDSGADGLTVSNVGDAQVADPINATLSLVSASTKPVNIGTKESLYLFCNGDGLFLDPVVGTLAYYDGTTQLHRFATDGTFRSLGAVRPLTNNTASLGIAGARWSEVFAVNGTINTSDERLKEQIRELSDAEHKVAVKIKGLIKAFKFKHAVAAKGAAARIHIGVIVQEVITAFNSEGLDPFDYGIVCHDTWEQELADDGSVAIEAGDVYSIRYEELLAFIIAAL